MPKKKKENKLAAVCNGLMLKETEIKILYKDGEEDAELVLKMHPLTFAQRIEFIQTVANACFVEDEETGEEKYYPSNYELAFHIAVLRFMTDAAEYGDLDDMFDCCAGSGVFLYQCAGMDYADYISELEVDCSQEIEWRKKVLLNNNGVMGIVAKFNKILNAVDAGIEKLNTNIGDINKVDLDKIVGFLGDTVTNPDKVAEKFMELRKEEAIAEAGEA